MDDLGFNKIAGAVLATALGMMLLMKLPGVFMAHADESIAYPGDYVPNPEPTPKGLDLPFPQQDWIDAMDAAKGAKVFNKCKSCHTVEAGGINGTGPALYGVVDNDIATQDGFSYSNALTGLPDNWDYEALDSYLKKPAVYAPGTKMTFFGLKKPEDRAAVIEYLRVSDPTPSPKPVAAIVETEDVSESVETAEEAGEPTELRAPEVPAEPIEPTETPQ